MHSRAWYEIGVLGLLVVLLLGLSIPSLLHARKERRDGIRRTELLEFKRMLEEANNELGYYPAGFVASPHLYIAVEGDGDAATSWYLRAELENKAEEAHGFDEEYNVFYRIVRDGEKTYYDICGGESECGLEIVPGS